MIPAFAQNIKTYRERLQYTQQQLADRVKQYYALDQHTPIISRERYYLGLKLKKSNKGGWDDGIPVLRVCMRGALKGFVLAVPRWYGFGAADYIKTSLTAYDIELPGEQILPDYVIDMMDGAKEPEEIEDKTKDENEDKPENHFYYVSEEEFNSSPAPEPEEYAAEDTDSEEDPWYRSLIRNLRNQQGLFEQTQNIYDRSVSARLFDINAKPLLTIDHLGVFFNKACLHALHVKEEENDLTGIVIFFNPIRRQILIKQSEKPDPARVLNWTKMEKNKIVMRRCPAGALASAIYECMNWITSTKYKVPGTVCTEEGDRYLLFDLSDSIAYVKLRKNTEQQNPQNGAGLEIDRRILPDDLNTLLSDIKDDTESGGSGIKPEVRSSAVYYESEAEEREIRSFEYTEISDLASKEYIEHLWGRNIREGCEQDYISDIVAQKGNCVQIMQPEWANSFCGRTVSRIPFSENEKNEFVDSGWTTEYKLPSPEEVERRLAELKKI